LQELFCHPVLAIIKANDAQAAAGSGSGYSSMDFYTQSDNLNPATTNSLYNNDITDAIPIAEMSDGDMNASMQEALHRSSLEARYICTFLECGIL
jgi:hypothetical protein